MSREIVKTILDTINALDFWARARWGVKSMMSDDKECTLHMVLGRGKGKVMVKYETGSDLYTVTYGRAILRGAKAGEWKELGTRTDVYGEDLVSVIDGLLGEK